MSNPNFHGDPDHYYTSREQEIRLNRIVFLKSKLKEAAEQLEYWHRQDLQLRRLLNQLEYPTTEQEWLGNE